MPKKIPSKYEQDDPKSNIRKAQKKESRKQKPIGGVVEVSKDNLKQKGSGGIVTEAKDYKKMLKTGAGKKNKGYDKFSKKSKE